jgi:hypothetical protein
MLHRLAILVVLLLAACSPSAPPEPIAAIPAAATPADWQEIELESLSLALPPAWTVTLADAIDSSPPIDDLIERNPQLAAIVREGEAALRAGQIELVAYDLDPAALDDGDIPTSLRVGSQRSETPPSADQVADANEAQLRATPGFSNVERAPISLGDTAATRLTSTLTITDTAGEPLAFHSEQYLIVDDATVQILSFTLPESNRARSRPVLDQILATVRLRD